MGYPASKPTDLHHVLFPASGVTQRSPSAGIHGGGSLRWVPVYTGTTVGRRRTPHGRAAAHPHRHSREGGNPRRVETAMGSRLHGNDGRRRRTPHGRRRRTHIVIPATAGIHVGRGACDGFPSTRERRRAAARLHTVGRRRAHIVIPATAGIQGGVSLRWVPVYTGTTVGDGGPHTVGGGAPPSSFPRRRESTAGEPAMGSRLHGNDGRAAAHPTRWATAHPHGRAAAHPISSFPRRRESTWGGEPAMGSRLHGNDGRAAAHPTRWATAHPHGRAAAHPTSSFPRRREGGDGFPSTRERRWAAAHPTR